MCAVACELVCLYVLACVTVLHASAVNVSAGSSHEIRRACGLRVRCVQRARCQGARALCIRASTGAAGARRLKTGCRMRPGPMGRTARAAAARRGCAGGWRVGAPRETPTAQGGGGEATCFKNHGFLSIGRPTTASFWPVWNRGCQKHWVFGVCESICFKNQWFLRRVRPKQRVFGHKRQRIVQKPKVFGTRTPERVFEFKVSGYIYLVQACAA